MKKFTVLLLMITASFHFTTAQTGWVQQNSGTFFNLNSVCFVDANTGYAVGDSGSVSIRHIILKTSNGGTNWIRQDLLNDFDELNSVFFLDANTGFACGNISGGHNLYRTTNGGTNWYHSFFNDQNRVFSLYFVNALTGFMAGERPQVKLVSGMVLKTTDGGLNWIQQELFYPANFYSIFFINDLTGFTCGGSPMFKTTNTGVSWFETSYPPITANSIYFSNSLSGWITGQNSVYKTTNSGNNWLLNYSQSCSQLYSMRFVNDQTGWVCGCQGNIYGTLNGGTNWLMQSTGTTTNLHSLSFVNAFTGWAVGDLGRILITTNGGITFLKPISNEIPEKFSLFQNYPNPFNPTTKIRFAIPFSNKGLQPLVILKLYDALGREAETIVNEQLNAGTYEVDWPAPSGNINNYPSGVYFYKLTAGDYSATKKMVLIK